MDVCLMIEGQEGVTWDQWLSLALACEEHGFEGLFRSDHYLSFDHAHERGAFDAWATMAALASITERIRLGTLVSPVGFRHPSDLAKSVVTVDHASDGRVELGMGAGWFEREHRAFGFPFPSDAERMDVLTEQIAGYYDPDTKKLTISKSAGDDPTWAEMVLAHELDHGLQDQAFDLKKFEDLPDEEGDASAARRALVEGDGIALMLEVMFARNGMPVPWANPQVAEMIEKAMTVPGNGDGLDKAPLAIREALIFPYRAGFGFVAALRRRQPWTAVDKAFARPPRSTEQIIHPARYLSDEQPVGVAIDAPAALKDYTRAHATVWGELGFELFLRSQGVDAAAATQAAEGWGGDRAIVLVRGGDKRPQRAVGISRSEWDTEADAIEAGEAVVKAVDALVVGATVEHAQTRTRWFGVDGTVSWVERKGPSVVIVIGAPVWAADALGAQVWTATHVKPASPTKKPK